MIGLSTGEVPSMPATGNDILLESDVKIRIQYAVSNPGPDDGYDTQGTMAVTLTASDKVGFVSLGFPGESGVMVGAQVILEIPQYNMMIVHY